MEERKIGAKIVADSKDERGNRITTYLLTYPRFIHAEVMTHRMFSRNAASSRAIPFAKMVKYVQEDPFIPIAFQKDHKGMQGSEYLEDKELASAKTQWLKASQSAVGQATRLSEEGITKQLCNRVLEPFLWYTNLVTATEYDNFFELRCPKYTFHDENGEYVYRSKKDAIHNFGKDEGVIFEDDTKTLGEFTDLDWIKLSESHAEIHIQALAEAMGDARNESMPKTLEEGEWHIPFGDKFDREKIVSAHYNINSIPKDYTIEFNFVTGYEIKIATARCARLSYMTFDGEINYIKDIGMHDDLLEAKHASPFEHCSQVMSDEDYYNDERGVGLSDERAGWCRNFRGFMPYRHLVKL